jgi:hypothetical protein
VTAFAHGWSLLKAPWYVMDEEWAGDRPSVEEYYADEEPDIVRGPLYSGGSRGDKPRYWTRNFDEALRYALFGSAIGGKSGMRQTVPQVMVAEDPGPLDPSNFLFEDPETWDPDRQRGAVMSHGPIYDQDLPIDYAPMDENELRVRIGAVLDELRDEGMSRRFMDEGYGVGDTSAQFENTEDVVSHVEQALERLNTGEAGRLTADPMAGTAETFYRRVWRGMD